MATTEETAEATEVTTDNNNEWIEYTGDPDSQHGTAFLHSHTIPKGDPVWKRLGVKPTKDLVWERDPLGPAIGSKGNRMLLSTEGLDRALVDAVAKIPGFKVVNE
jgi:hypothetical protein